MARESGQGRGPEERIRRSKEERRRIVEATIGTGVSVARVARAHGVNANQVYAWRRLYEKGLLGASAVNHAALVPVRLTDAVPAAPISVHSTGARRAPSGAIQIDFAKARVHIEGSPEPGTLRVVLDCLLG